MKISYNWLKNYINLTIKPEEVDKILSSIGLEVEAMESVEQIPGGLEGVVVGEVVECSKHPDADKLSLTKVNTGGEELLQIVCGAPNVAAGQKVLVATVGTNLKFSNGEEIKIKRSKIRGVESMGMICAEDELGIGTSHEGIMVLPAETKVGVAAREYLNLKSDTIFEIGLTPNRVDAASHIGVARDLSAYLKLNGKSGDMILPSVSEFENLKRTSSSVRPIEIVVDSKDGAPRYSGLTFDNIKIAPSPEWLQTALKSVGLRPINNVVDITNYILQETGQPLHAFDYSKIEGGKVVVREARKGERFVTLDGVERELSPEDVMICNINSPMCIGGVFGGLHSGVSNETTAIFLESAYFNPVSIRKTSKRHSLKTDASFRYERGADPANVPYALKRAAILLQEITGANVVGDICEVYPKPIERVQISLDFNRIEEFIGKKIGAGTIMAILGYMDFEAVTSSEYGAEVLAPLYRVDVTRECDVVEEVLRIYGYNNIELPGSVHASINATPKPDPEKVRSLAADFLANNGFYETMNNSLTKSEYYSKLKTFPENKLVRILNPLSTDLNSMRQTLIINGLEVISYNINRQHPDLKLFEMGNVYSIENGTDGNDLISYAEAPKLSLFVSGPGNASWRNVARPASYFSLKGYLELLLKRFGIRLDELEYEAAPADIFTEGLIYKTQGGKELAIMGTINNQLLKQFGIKQQVFAAEISWNVLFNQVKKQKVLFSELPKFPEVRRDLALLIDENVSFAELRKLAFKTEKKILKQVTLFDVYRGDKIPDGKKQYALSFTLQDIEKTLTDKYVEEVMNRLLGSFMERFGATLR
ncbi:MAG: phenylalanine--tRNA ligase subunit beta [Bacteroidetes bacterium GWF2_40_14]|nr:MAG: phenylalanine--tRNA ligase subunit beta [Bacteroidetes bacterium GWF2_40_14]